MEEENTPYSVEIDFEEASGEWLKNKKKRPNGFYVYRCAHWSKTHNRYCKCKVFNDGLCKYHLRSN